MRFEDADMMSPDTHTDDPWALYQWMRDEAPLFWDEANDLWAVSRYEDVVFVSKRTDLFCSSMGVVPNVGTDIWPDEAMINLDGDAHTRQRALVSKGFSPRRVERMRSIIEAVIDELITEVAPRGEADLVMDLVRPLPFRVITKMLGYPSKGNEALLDWTDTYTGAGSGPEFITEEVVEAFSNFAMFHEEQIEAKKRCPADDLLSVWLEAELDGEKLSEDKMMYEHNLLLVGGSETTRGALSLGIKALFEHPEQLAWLRANLDDEQAVARAVEELLRWSCPFVRMRRTATRDVEMHGETIREGQQIIMLYPAANRDPRAFADPDRFDLQRDEAHPSLSFGFGKHYCLGARLARLEIRMMLKALLSRLPDLRARPDGEIVHARSSFVRGLTSQPVLFTATP